MNKWNERVMLWRVVCVHPNSPDATGWKCLIKRGGKSYMSLFWGNFWKRFRVFIMHAWVWLWKKKKVLMGSKSKNVLFCIILISFFSLQYSHSRLSLFMKICFTDKWGQVGHNDASMHHFCWRCYIVHVSRSKIIYSRKHKIHIVEMVPLVWPVLNSFLFFLKSNKALSDLQIPLFLILATSNQNNKNLTQKNKCVI